MDLAGESLEFLAHAAATQILTSTFLLDKHSVLNLVCTVFNKVVLHHSAPPLLLPPFVNSPFFEFHHRSQSVHGPKDASRAKREWWNPQEVGRGCSSQRV